MHNIIQTKHKDVQFKILTYEEATSTKHAFFINGLVVSGYVDLFPGRNLLMFCSVVSYLKKSSC